MNYKKWALHLLLWIIIINLIVPIAEASSTIFESTRGTLSFMIVLNFIGMAFFLIGLIFLVLSLIKKEKKDSVFWAACIGYILLSIISIIIP